MNEINYEQKQEKVAELAMAGQGCAIWDELKSLSRADLKHVIEGVQEKTANPDFKELRHLPAVVVKPDPLNLPGLFSYSITAVDGVVNKTRTEILFQTNSFLGDNHECLNLNIGDRQK